MKQIDTLIISGASITASPWFTWADVVCEILKPRQVINLSARGTSNYYIAVSCINAILNADSKNTLCMPMFTGIDKFDMYLNPNQTADYINEKHRPIDITGQPAVPGQFGFWSTGSHWPLIKQHYYNNFFDPDIACVNNMLVFSALEKLCESRGIDLFPIFDMEIWQYQEQEINAYLTQGAELQRHDFLSQPLSAKIKPVLSSEWFEFVSLIQYAMNNNLPIYNDINKMHPPSNVHMSWVDHWIRPRLEKQYSCSVPSNSFIRKLDTLSQAW